MIRMIVITVTYSEYPSYCFWFSTNFAILGSYTFIFDYIRIYSQSCGTDLRLRAKFFSVSIIINFGGKNI